MTPRLGGLKQDWNVRQQIRSPPEAHERRVLFHKIQQKLLRPFWIFCWLLVGCLLWKWCYHFSKIHFQTEGQLLETWKYVSIGFSFKLYLTSWGLAVRTVLRILTLLVFTDCFSSSTPLHAHFISTAASKAPESPGTQPSRRHSQIQFAKAFTFRTSVKFSLVNYCLKPKSGHLCPGFSVAWLQNLPVSLWPPFPRRDFSIQLIYLLLLTQTSTSLRLLLFLMCVWVLQASATHAVCFVR